MRALAAAGGWPTVTAGAADQTRRHGSARRADQKAPAGDWRAARRRQHSTIRRTARISRPRSRRFQAHHRLTDDGVIGKATIDAMNVSAETRVQQLRVNLERARWVVGGLAYRHVRAREPAGVQGVSDSRSQERLGDADADRPRGATDADVPRRHEVPGDQPGLDRAADDPGAGRPGRHAQGSEHDRQEATADSRSAGPRRRSGAIDWQNATPANFPYTLRQPPGPDNALGRVKFIFPNQYSIFLHDTPSRELFASDQRTFSSGCIRVEHPLDLAAVLLEGQDNWTAARIQEAVDSKQQQTVFLKTRRCRC